MGEARGLLAQREPGKAVPPEGAALAALQRAGGRAQQSLDDLAAMQEMRQGSPGTAFGAGAPAFLRPGGGSSGPARDRRSGAAAARTSGTS